MPSKRNADLILTSADIKELREYGIKLGRLSKRSQEEKQSIKDALTQIRETRQAETQSNPIDFKAKIDELRTKVSGWIKPHHRGTEAQRSSNPNAERNWFWSKSKKPAYKVGDIVKIRLRKGKESERIWTILTKVKGGLQGKLDNEPVVATGLHQGDTVSFTRRDILDVYKNPSSKRNYTEEVRSSSGQTIFINVDETSKGWRAEGYPVVKGRIRRVAKPLIAYGDSEARAYDNLVERLDKNPRKCKGKKTKRNLDEIERAAELAGEFRGYPAERITESGEPNKMRDDYAHLGWSEQFVFVPPSFHEELDCAEISEFYNEEYQQTGNSEKSWSALAEELGIPLMVFDVTGDEIRLVASADGKQLYFLGGKQAQFKDFLSDFDADTNKDRVSLGVLLCVVYSAQKVQAGDDEERGYYHVFGEEDGTPPGAFFDTLNNRIMLFGGTYHLNEAERGIIN
jgi:hypothetical protein